MFKQITFSILLAGLMLGPIQSSAANPFSSIKDFLKPSNIKTTLKDEVADLHIGTGTTLLDVDLAGAVGFSTKYKYEVEPSHNDGFYTRIDQWKLKVSLRPGDMIGGISSPLFFNIDKGSNVYFIRQFKKQKNAITALPYTFLKLPLTAKMAKEKLNPGDLVQIPTRMSLAFGAGTGTSLNQINAGVSVMKALSGEFFINIFRMKDNHARVRIVSKKVNSRNIGFGSELEFNLFGVRVVDNYVEKLIETDLAKINFGKHKGEQFILDYIFDLDNAQAVSAYNEILSASYKLKDLEIMKEFIRKKGLENRLFHVFEESEEIAIKDKDSEVKRIQRLFKGFNQFKGNNRNLKLGAIITSFGKGTVYRKNKLAEENLDGERNIFYYHTLTINQGRSFGLGALSLKEKANQTLLAVLPENIATSKTDFADIGFLFNIKDSIMRVREQKYLNRDIKMNLPKYAQDALNWKITNHQIKSANVALEVYIKGSALANIEEVSKRTIYKKFTKLLKTYEREGKTFGEVATGVVTDTLSFGNVNQYAEKKRAARTLHKVLFSKMTAEQRVEKIVSLKKNTIFKRIGFAVIMSFINEKDQRELTYTNVKISGKKIETVYFRDGDINTPNVYKQLRNLQNSFNGNSYSIFY